MTPFALVGAIALTVPFLVILRRNWVIRHLAVRNAVRRPAESMLLIVGALFGTAIITASFVVGDTLESSIKSSAFTQLGEIDELATTRDPRVYSDLVKRLAPVTEHDAVDGVLSILSVPVSVQFDGPSGAMTAPGSKLVEVDFDAVPLFGSDPQASGLSGATPAPARAVISQHSADTLGARPGDEITVYVLGNALPLTVTEVVPQRGIAGFSQGSFDLGRNVFVAPGTVDGLVPEGAGVSALGSVQRSVAVSNTGDVLGGVGLSDAVVATMTERIGDLGPVVRPVKAELVATAEETSSTLGELFFAMGVFGGLAGALLVVNLFVMLAEERKVQLGMFRALGMTQGSLIQAFSVEGWLYGLVAATFGVTAGLGLGWVIVRLVARSINAVGGDLGLDLVFGFDWASLRDGFLLGLAVSTMTVVLAGLRFARVNIISAIRDLPAPRRSGDSRLVAVGAVVALLGGVVWTIVAFGTDDGVGIVLAPLLAGAGLAAIFRAVASPRIVGTVLALASMVWATIAIRIVVARMEEPEVNAFVAQGVALTAASVALVSLHQQLIGRLARSSIRGPRSLMVSLGVAYPLSRLMRTALTVGMYALVVFTLTFITVLSGIFSTQLQDSADQLSGGSDVLVRSVAGNPIPLDEVAGRPDVDGVAPLIQQPVLIVDPADPAADPLVWFSSAFDERLVEVGPPLLRDRGEFETDEAAYRAVLADDSLVIIDPLVASSLLDTQGLTDIGSTLTLVDPSSGTTRTVQVAAIGPTDLSFNGMLMGSPIAPSGVTIPATRALVSAAAGSDPELLAASISSDYAKSGAEAETIASIVDRAATAESQFFDLARGYLALGMVVGVAGLGVVLVRAVRERRRQIGVMRSLGLQPGAIGWSLIVEATLVALEGTVIGVALGVFTAYNIVTSTTLVGLDIGFVVPALDIGVLVTLVVVASLSMTVIPARRATRIRPAVALRIAD